MDNKITPNNPIFLKVNTSGEEELKCDKKSQALIKKSSIYSGVDRQKAKSIYPASDEHRGCLEYFFDIYNHRLTASFIKKLMLYKVKSKEFFFERIPKTLLSECITAEVCHSLNIIEYDLTQDMIKYFSKEKFFELYLAEIIGFNFIPIKFREDFFMNKEVYTAIYIKGLPLKIDNIPCYELLKNPYIIPTKNWTRCFILESLKTKPEMIKSVDSGRHDYDELVNVAIQYNGNTIEKINKNYLKESHVDYAISKYPAPKLKNIPKKYLTVNICKTAILNGNKSLVLDPAVAKVDNEILYDKDADIVYEKLNVFTQSMELLNLAIPCKHSLLSIPESLINEEICGKYLESYPSLIEDVPRHILVNKKEWCIKAVQINPYRMIAVPNELKKLEFCLEVLKHNGKAIMGIPTTLLDEHPFLIAIAIKYDGSHFVPSKYWNHFLCNYAINQDPNNIKVIPEKFKENFLWALAVFEPKKLPRVWKQYIVRHGDTCYLPNLPVIEKLSESEMLICSQGFSGKYINKKIFIELKKLLISCKPFVLPNYEIGISIENFCFRHINSRKDELNTQKIEILNVLPKNWQVYGGRTLHFFDSVNEPCQRFKFLRRGENLNDFFREEAIHLFLQKNANISSILKSEVPLPDNIFLIEQKIVPKEILDKFSSTLENILINHVHYYLIYKFSTKNLDYSFLAHQQLENIDYQEAEEAIHKTAYDLGKWSSMGIVYTSTIQAFHNFRDNRKLLFLINLFSSKYDLPGCISYWSTKAIEQSDWSYAGLKDLGDFEIYPKIDSYLSATNAEFLITGYGQRCSFLEGFVSNIVAAVLHYAKLHRNNHLYHYKNTDSINALSSFLIKLINSFINGLFNDNSHFIEDFDDQIIFNKWIKQTAIEIIYWTANITLNTDNILNHLKVNGKFPDEIDNAEYKDLNYNDLTKELKYNSLGLSNELFPLLSLIKGLAFISGRIALRLT